MSLYSLIMFGGIYALAALTPGPGVAAVIARAMAIGLPGMFAFILGILIGDCFWLLCAALGLTAVSKVMAGILTSIRIIGALYMLWLAWQIWQAPISLINASSAAPKHESAWHAFVAGLSLTITNPKAIIFFLALLPAFVDLPTLTYMDVFKLLGVGAIVLPSVMWFYALLAIKMRQRIHNKNALRILNRGLSLVLVGIAFLLLTA